MIALLLAAAAALQPIATAPRRAPPPAAPPAQPAAELWVLDQISFPLSNTNADAATLKALEPDHSIEAVATRLALLNIKYERNIITIDTSKLPPALIANLRTLPPTEPFAIPAAGNRMTISIVLSRRPRPATPGNRAAPLPPPSAAAAASIDRLLDVMNVAEQFDVQVSRMIEAVLPGIVANNNGHADEVRKIVGEELRASFLKSRPLLLAKTRELYLARFTAPELGQLVSFYESPIGRKVTSMSSGIGAEMAQFGQQVGRAVSADAQPRILARLRAANLQPPQGV